MKIEVLNKEGKSTGRSVNIPDDLVSFEPNDHAIYLDVKQYLANQRQGTHKAKEKFEVNYSTKKIKKQKGTGGARAGSIKSGVFVGGGRIFGPRVRDYYFKLNKKLKKLARKSALVYKIKSNDIVVFENISFEKPSTKEFNSILSNINAGDVRTLFITNETNKNVYLSSRNIQKNQVMTLSDMNTYQIMKAKKLILTEDAALNLTTNFNN